MPTGDGPTIRNTATCGFPRWTRVGPRIAAGAGCGWISMDGRGSDASLGDGLRITTATGTRPPSAGPGTRGRFTRGTTGGPRWSASLGGADPAGSALVSATWDGYPWLRMSGSIRGTGADSAAR